MAVPVRGRADLGVPAPVGRTGDWRSGRWSVGRSSPAVCLGVLYVGNSGRTTPRSRRSRRRSPRSSSTSIRRSSPSCRSGSRTGCRAGGRGSRSASRWSASSSRSVASTRTTRRRSAAWLSRSPRASSTRSGSSSRRRISASGARAVADASGQAGSATAAVAIIMTATADGLLGGRPRDRPAGAARPDPVGGLGRAHRRRCRGDVHRDPDVLRGRAAGRAPPTPRSSARPSRSGRSPWPRSCSRVALTPVQLVGGAFILAGVVIAQTGPVARAGAGARTCASRTSDGSSAGSASRPGAQDRPRAAGDEADVRAEPDEPEAELAMARDDGRVVQQDAGRLAGGLGDRRDVADRLEVAGSSKRPGTPRLCDRSAGPTNRTSTPSMAAISAACSTALGDSIWMIPRIVRVDRPDVGVGPLAEAGATGREREPAGAVGRVAHERDRLADLVRRVHARDHQRRARRGRGHARCAAARRTAAGRAPRSRVVPIAWRLATSSDSVVEAVLEVDDQPVEADAGQDLGRDRRPERRERAVEGLAGWRRLAQVDEARDGGEGGGGRSVMAA